MIKFIDIRPHDAEKLRSIKETADHARRQTAVDALQAIEIQEAATALIVALTKDHPTG